MVNYNFIKRAGLPYKILIRLANELGIPRSQIYKRISEIASYGAQKSNVKQQALKAKENWMKGIKPDYSKQEADLLKNIVLDCSKELSKIKELESKKPKQMEFKF